MDTRGRLARPLFRDGPPQHDVARRPGDHGHVAVGAAPDRHDQRVSVHSDSAVGVHDPDNASRGVRCKHAAAIHKAHGPLVPGPATGAQSGGRPWLAVMPDGAGDKCGQAQSVAAKRDGHAEGQEGQVHRHMCLPPHIVAVGNQFGGHTGGGGGGGGVTLQGLRHHLQQTRASHTLQRCLDPDAKNRDLVVGHK